MKTCNDCIHQGLCFQIGLCDVDDNETCQNFKNKSNYVEAQTEPEPMKNLLVVYSCTTKRGDFGVCRCHQSTNAKLPLSIDSIKQIEESLKKDFHYKNVVLLNYFLLGDE